MKFIDETVIIVAAGKGGNGMVSFARARNKPRMGPNGGDGGFGADVVLIGDEGLNTLSNFRYRKRYVAEDGGNGQTNNKTGRDGQDLLMRVPIGCQAFDAETDEMIGEVLRDGEKLVVAKGGKRGMGNVRWVSPTHQAPDEHTDGAEGERRTLRLELKLLADVGLAGFPNAGKSTLLSCLSAARPKVADYPFTTLTPTLGVVEIPGKNPFETESFVMADIPGLVEGAADGKGLGHEFLRHIERTKILVFLLDPFGYDGVEPKDALKVLRNELKRHDPELAKRRSIVVFSKSDLADDDFDFAKAARPIKKQGFEVLSISSAQNKGLAQLKRRLMDLVIEERERVLNEASEADDGNERPAAEGTVYVDRS